MAYSHFNFLSSTFGRQAIGPDNVDTGRAMDMVMRHGNNCSFITGRTLNQVSRSLYGQRKVQNMTRDIRSARNFKQPQSAYHMTCSPGRLTETALHCRAAVDENRKRGLQQEFEQVKEQMDSLKAKYEDLKPKDDELRQEFKEKEKEKVSLH
jgi:structural maintenance of chromosomes protein 5